MKFVYSYNTKDNERREGVISAVSRDRAYVLLKKNGIRPSRVVLAPGWFNHMLSLGWRWYAICGLLVVAIMLSGRLFVAENKLKSAGSEWPGLQVGLEPTPRRQIIGDSAVIEKGIRTGWASVFSHDGEQFLASFAVPGVPAGIRSTSEAEIVASLNRKIVVSPSDGIEARQIKSMVEGLKVELREYLSAGGSVQSYGDRLVRRQEDEIGFYNRARAELDAAARNGASEQELEDLWERRNAELRRMGIRLLNLWDRD